MTNLARQIPNVLECIDFERWGRKAPMLALVASRTWEEGTYTVIDRKVLADYGRSGTQAAWDLEVLHRLEADRILQSIGSRRRPKAWRLAGADPGIVRRWHDVPWIMAKSTVIGYLRGESVSVVRARARVIARQNTIGGWFDTPSDRMAMTLLRLGLATLGRGQPTLGRDFAGLSRLPTDTEEAALGAPIPCLLDVPSEHLFSSPLGESGAERSGGVASLSEEAKTLIQAVSETVGLPVIRGSVWERRLAAVADAGGSGRLERLVARARTHGRTRRVELVIEDLETRWPDPEPAVLAVVERCQTCVLPISEVPGGCWSSECPRKP